jgi:hypothetical protein
VLIILLIYGTVKMSTQFFTNRDDNNLFTKFQGVLEHIPNLHSFDALVGYFRSTGYFKLRPFSGKHTTN